MRRICKVLILDDNGYVSKLTLDSSKLDNIGTTKESLREYMKIILTPGQRYICISDETQPTR